MLGSVTLPSNGSLAVAPSPSVSVVSLPPAGRCAICFSIRGVPVGVTVGVLVTVNVGVIVGVFVRVGVSVIVGELVTVGVSVTVGVRVVVAGPVGPGGLVG